MSQERLISLVAGWLLDRTDAAELSAKSASPDHSANIRQNVSDAIARLPKLTTGLSSFLAPSSGQAPHQTSCSRFLPEPSKSRNGSGDDHGRRDDLHDIPECYSCQVGIMPHTQRPASALMPTAISAQASM